jgi:hypothetical protein
MSYILFLVTLTLSAIAYCVIKPFYKSVSLDSIFRTFATFVSYLPILFMILLLWVGVTGLVVLALRWSFERLGVLKNIEAWHIWAVLPAWGWVLIAFFAVTATGNALLILRSRPGRGLSVKCSKL